MNTDENNLAVAREAALPRSVHMSNPQHVAVVNAPDSPPQEGALDQPRPRPQSIADEIALEQQRLGEFLRGPVRTRKASEISRVLQLLDEIGKDDDE